MALTQNYNIGGINLYLNPLLKKDGECIRAVNVESTPYGAKTKRSGYSLFGGSAGVEVNSLFQFIKNNGTSNFLYKASGTTLQYANEGAGGTAWATCGNGTITSGAHIDYAVLDDTLIICDGAGSTRHTTNGTSFTNTTGAPVAVSLEQYQNRIYAAGTSSDLFYSTTGNAADWSTTGTSDSSSLKIPGGGKLNKVFKQNDRIIVTKNSNVMFKWDGYELVDMATNLAPTSPQSVSNVEDYAFWMNRLGMYGFGGNRPELLSNPVQPLIYNNSGSAIVGTIFDAIPSTVHRFDYLASIGTVTDDFTSETIDNCVLNYNYQKNEFLTRSYYNNPTAYMSYKDRSGVQQLMFGDANGQCYEVSGTATSDNGNAIETVMEFIVHGGVPHLDKKWNSIYAFFNPGNRAKIQVAFSDTYVKNNLMWKEIGDCSSGVFYERFTEARSKFLYVKIYESSSNSQFSFYGFAVDSTPIAK